MLLLHCKTKKFAGIEKSDSLENLGNQGQERKNMSGSQRQNYFKRIILCDYSVLNRL